MWKFGVKTHYISELRELEDGSRVKIAGWVQRKSELGGIVFLRLRDSTGSVQVVVREGEVTEHELTA
ncbi:MAG: OB-fold nucleic acid binding domain-containing protein, partial [Candidatus Korarchaeum sp.]